MNKVDLQQVVLPVQPVERQPGKVPTKTVFGQGFKEVLQQKLEPEGIRFSSHCLKRLEQHNIQLSNEQLARLNSAVAQAQLKGSKDSCIVMDDMAFVVSVNNRKVITVVEGARMKDSVFTNIDSAVLVGWTSLRKPGPAE